MRIVYRPDSENDADRASSLNSDEKLLFEELQKELLDLKRNMRNHEEELSRRVSQLHHVYFMYSYINLNHLLNFYISMVSL